MDQSTWVVYVFTKFTFSSDLLSFIANIKPNIICKNKVKISFSKKKNKKIDDLYFLVGPNRNVLQEIKNNLVFDVKIEKLKLYENKLSKLSHFYWFSQHQLQLYKSPD